ncbi:PROLINE-RICH PROTEIN APG putative-RELATED [Salix koriyanagi]|uniref:PROLINE-RICH PROTEIN APG putative-RELATED n=1 Tax=Salix koriyanagi TaxID=2511006 RepID=A0A9Q0WTF9_9ROSI|nr:PROLINE-RICH PROTEIN APG putative-RELATED [Salix koriyanagi]
MEKQVHFIHFLFALFCFSYTKFSEGLVNGRRENGSVKLFVFGDSYADTGNWEKFAASWKEPYGFTFPGKPAGRFSDGRVLTDYIASFLGIQSPVPYTWRKTVEKSGLQSGMNFAFGGTGVFDTFINAPNMSTQIDFFQQLLEEKAYTKQDLNSSIALVSLAGNDYTTYIQRNGKLQGLPAFTTSLISQLSASLKRIHGFGVRKIAVTTLQPLGCLPISTAFSSYENCSESWNAASRFHNQKLQQEIQRMNKESRENIYETLDLYTAFMSKLSPAGNMKPSSFLMPCCVGMASDYSCGNIDKNGGKEVCGVRKARSVHLLGYGTSSTEWLGSGLFVSKIFTSSTLLGSSDD